MLRLSIALAVLGLLADTLLVGWFGVGRVAATVLSVGWAGFLAYVGVQLALFAVLGLAWWVILPPDPAASGRLRVAIAARLVRDSAATCLPFSQVGGFVFGARAMTLGGVGWTLATLSTVVDITGEFIGQIGFAAVGLIVLVARVPNSSLAVPLAVGIAVALAAAAGFITVQLGAGRAMRLLGARIAAGWLNQAALQVDAAQRQLAALYARRGAIGLACTLHWLAWIGTGLGTWMAYRLLGVDIDVWTALAIEALVDTVLNLAFLVPGGVGIQEAGYASIGLVFGIPAELSIGLSLLRRGRDLAIGIPTLLAWQWAEARRLGVAGRA